jgi:hypothetical protein
MARREWVHVNEVQRILDETEGTSFYVVRMRLQDLIREQVAGTEDDSAEEES